MRRDYLTGGALSSDLEEAGSDRAAQLNERQPTMHGSSIAFASGSPLGLWTSKLKFSEGVDRNLARRWGSFHPVKPGGATAGQ
jgi:hypothetical protein